ncbi:MAG: glycosyltransferase family 4 protein [Bacteroidota bacterium]
MILEVNGDYHKRDESISLVKRLIMKMMFEVAVRFADAVKVLNCEQEIYLRRLFPRKQIYRFPNFVATEYFGSLNAFKGDYLLSVGHPFHLKGMDILIRAFKRLCNRFPKARLKIMGYCPNPELQWYKELAGNDPRIEFVPPGWIEEVGEQVRGCLALVNAARSEAMGRIHVEAMACKKPIVASRTSGALECVEDGRTGLLCEVGADVDLAEKLEQFLSDADLATRMGRAGLERMRKIFSQEKYVSSFMAMVEEVVPTQGARLAGHNDGSRQDCSVGKESIATSKTV